MLFNTLTRCVLKPRGLSGKLFLSMKLVDLMRHDDICSDASTANLLLLPFSMNCANFIPFPL